MLDLHAAALHIFQHALSAVDARTATRNALELHGTLLRIKDSQFDLATSSLYVVGIGKAAISMSLGVNDVLGEQVSAAIVSSIPSSTHSLPDTYRLYAGGHPLPNQHSLDAAEAAFQLLDRANKERAVVLFLVSGGGSAMLEKPVTDEITLADLQEANRQLVTCGATIGEVNAVRRTISAVKGGGLLRRAPDAQVVTLIVSDTNPGEERNVASGPTLNPPDDLLAAKDVVEKYGLAARLPSSVVSGIQANKSFTRSDRDSAAATYVLLDNDVAMRAAAEKAFDLGFSTVIDSEIHEQPVEEGSELLLARAGQISNLPSCLISGGEFGCRVRGNGRGGRNLETVLRCAIKLSEERSDIHTVVLSVGTDGVDGSSSAAGAIADEGTIAKANSSGLNAVEFLENSDSHSFFEQLGALVFTGPTGTNVRDLRIVLRQRP